MLKAITYYFVDLIVTYFKNYYVYVCNFHNLSLALLKNFTVIIIILVTA